MKTATLDRLHGIALIALMSLSAFYIAGIPEVKALSLSPLIVGIIIGMIYANTLRCRMPKEWEPGIKFCTKRLLRLGIIFYGFRLTLSDVAAVGLPAVTVDTIIVAGTLLQHLCGAATVKDIPLNGAIEYADTFMLTIAMTALGTDTGIDKFRQAGAKPFLLAAMLYVWLIVGGYFITQAVTAAF